MSASVATARLTSTPELVTGDGVAYWSASAQLETTLHTVPVRVDALPGVWLPLRRGDRVLLAVTGGSVAAGARVVGWFGDAVTPTAARNTEWHARGAGSLRLLAEGGGRVDLGEGAPAAQEPLACYPDMAAQIVNLQAQVDALTAFVQAITPLAPLGGAGATAAVLVAKGAVTVDGGRAATNVYALPEDAATVTP